MFRRNQKHFAQSILSSFSFEMSRKLHLVAIILNAWVLFSGVAVDELSGADKSANTVTKVLHFPAERHIGWLFVEAGRDLSSPLGLDPERVALEGNWDFVGLAQGDVTVPANRNIQLTIHLGSGPEDLSCLAKLGPSDLYKLNIQSSTRRSSANCPRLESISHLTGLQVLSLGNTGVTGGQMSSLKSLSSLRGIQLIREMSFGGAGLAALKEFPALEYLDCYTNTTDAELQHISQLANLKWLRLRMGRIGGPGLVELAKIPYLERLALWGDKGLSDRHVRYLEGLRHLKSLTLWGSDAHLTNSTLASVSKLSSLEELHLIRVKTDFTDSGIGQLAKLNNLRILGASPRDASVLAGMGQLESVSGIVLTSRNMKALAGLSNLKSLGLKLEAPVSGSDGNPVAMLSTLKSLETLHVVGWSMGAKCFGDEELASLESMRSLKDLSIPVEGLTDRGLASIGKLRQLESLNLMGTGKNNRLSNSGLNHLNGLSHLQKLCLNMPSGVWSVGDNTALNLSGLTNLKSIKLISICLKGSEWGFLAELENLEELWLNDCGVCSENGLRYIKDLPKLKVVDLQNVTCTEGNGLAVLGGLRNLNEIRLMGRVTDRALGRLPALPSLQVFDVQTDVTIRPETIAHLKKKLPAVRTVNIKQPTQEKRTVTRTRQGRGYGTPRRRSSRRIP
jgi:hypothetical protein